MLLPQFSNFLFYFLVLSNNGHIFPYFLPFSRIAHFPLYSIYLFCPICLLLGPPIYLNFPKWPIFFHFPILPTFPSIFLLYHLSLVNFSSYLPAESMFPPISQHRPPIFFEFTAFPILYHNFVYFSLYIPIFVNLLPYFPVVPLIFPHFCILNSFSPLSFLPSPFLFKNLPKLLILGFISQFIDGGDPDKP